MKKRFLIIVIVFTVFLFSVAALKTDNWKIDGITASFSANKNGIDFDELSLSVTGTINENMKLYPKFVYSPESSEDSGFILTVEMQKNLKLGGIFSLMSKMEQYVGTDISLCFRNPEKRFCAVELDVTSEFLEKFESDNTLTSKVGFLVSLVGDSSRTDFHFTENFGKEEKFGLNTSGKLHFIDKEFKVEDFVAAAGVYLTKHFVPSLSFEYSYDNVPKDNGLYAVLNLNGYKTADETLEINAYAKAGAHLVDDEMVFDVKKASASAEYLSNIKIPSSGRCYYFMSGIEYINDLKNSVQENGLFAKFYVSGRILKEYANRTGISFKIEKLESIKDLDFRFLSENYLSTTEDSKFLPGER